MISTTLFNVDLVQIKEGSPSNICYQALRLRRVYTTGFYPNYIQAIQLLHARVNVLSLAAGLQWNVAWLNWYYFLTKPSLLVKCFQGYEKHSKLAKENPLTSLKNCSQLKLVTLNYSISIIVQSKWWCLIQICIHS